MSLNISCQSLLACKVSFEKSFDSHMGTTLYVTVSFSLAAFKILSLSLIFDILNVVCLGVVLFGSNLFGTLCFLDLYIYFLCQIREVYFQFFQISSISCSSSSPYDTPMMRILDLLKLSQSLLYTILMFWGFFVVVEILVSSFCLVKWLSLPYAPNHCFDPVFLPFSVSFL